MKFLLGLLLVFGTFTSYSQGTDQQLAQHYYANGDFEKARIYYEKLYNQDPSIIHFTHYLDCLVQTNNKKEAEKLLKKQIASDRSNVNYKVMLGKFYEDNEEKEKAQKIYTNLIDDLTASPNEVIELFNAFNSKGHGEFAFKSIEKGRKLLKNMYPLHFQFAEYYGATGQSEKMINEYMDLLDFQSSYSSAIQSILSRQFDFSQPNLKEYDLLKSALLERAQKKTDEPVYAEMLVWLFIQKRNFSAALTQVQALDKRLGQQGERVFELGRMCVENKSYETARKAFTYIISLGEDKMLYHQAQNALLNTRFLEITNSRNYAQEELTAAMNEYKSVIKRLGKKRSSIPIIIELSHIQAFYANQADSAIKTLSELVTTPGITDIQRAEIKMQLADIHVLHGDIWESSLLYMQIEKDFKFEPIGHEAKFKNARVFYYDGEFDFAQSQLSVLKESTSKLIANDAMKLSLLITDNFGIDSNYQAMTWFANADLLIEQHRFTEAFVLFDSIVTTFPYHSLGDEILLRKSKAMQLQGNWERAIGYLEELLKYHKEDILADDAIFQLGDIYENPLSNNEKAIEYYKILLFDYKGSLYSVEVRKRLRKLRGETLSEEDSSPTNPN